MGKVVKEWVRREDLSLVNNMDCCEGVFTRSESPIPDERSKSVLDYVLVSRGLDHRMLDMFIDEDNLLDFDSDHRMITCIVSTGGVVEVRWSRSIPSLQFPTEADKVRRYRESLEANVSTVPVEEFAAMSLQAKLDFLIWAVRWACDQPLRNKGSKGRGAGAGAKSRAGGRDLTRLVRELKDIERVCGKNSGSYRKKIEGLRVFMAAAKEEWKRIGFARKTENLKNRLVEHPNGKNFWSFVKESARKSSALYIVRDKLGVEHTRKEDVKRTIYKEFEERFGGSNQPTGVVFRGRARPGAHNGTMEKPFSFAEVEGALRELKNGKAVSVDGIRNECLKSSGPKMRELLRVYMNDILSTRAVPQKLNNARVGLLHKSGDRRSPGNYRPIAVSSPFLKIFTVVFNKRLTKVIEDNRLLDDAQFGFRANRSTTEAVWILEQLIHKAKVEKTDCYLAFVDMSKAYDRVDRHHLLGELKRRGLGGCLTKILESMMDDDSLQFTVNGELTEKLYLRYGVRQGCNLSPNLFGMLMQPMAKRLMEEERGPWVNGLCYSTLQFADDIVCLATTVEGVKEAVKVVKEENVVKLV